MTYDDLDCGFDPQPVGHFTCKWCGTGVWFPCFDCWPEAETCCECLAEEYKETGITPYAEESV